MLLPCTYCYSLFNLCVESNVKCNKLILCVCGLLKRIMENAGNQKLKEKETRENCKRIGKLQHFNYLLCLCSYQKITCDTKTN